MDIKELFDYLVAHNPFNDTEITLADAEYAKHQMDDNGSSLEEACNETYETIEFPKRIVEFRSKVFDMANSGKYGIYPYDETFNEAVEDGFSDDGTHWTALNGQTFSYTNLTKSFMDISIYEKIKNAVKSANIKGIKYKESYPADIVEVDKEITDGLIDAWENGEDDTKFDTMTPLVKAMAVITEVLRRELTNEDDVRVCFCHLPGEEYWGISIGDGR